MSCLIYTLLWHSLLHLTYNDKTNTCSKFTTNHYTYLILTTQMFWQTHICFIFWYESFIFKLRSKLCKIFRVSNQSARLCTLRGPTELPCCCYNPPYKKSHSKSLYGGQSQVLKPVLWSDCLINSTRQRPCGLGEKKPLTIRPPLWASTWQGKTPF